MVWQDIVIAFVNVLLGYALIPQVIYGFKKKKKTITTQTSLITFIGLCSLVICYFTLNLYFSTIVTFLTSLLWLILFVQSIIYK